MTRKTNNVGFKSSLGRPIFFDSNLNTNPAERCHGDMTFDSNLRTLFGQTPSSRSEFITAQELEQSRLLKFMGGCEEYLQRKSRLFQPKGPNFAPKRVFRETAAMDMRTAPQNQSREEELIKEIERVQTRLNSVTEQLINSKAEREKLELKISEVKRKIKKESENLGVVVSDNPSDEEVQYLEKLTELAKEKARRSRIVKKLLERETFFKAFMGHKGIQDMDPLTMAIQAGFNTNNNSPQTDLSVINLFQAFGSALSSNIKNDTAPYAQE